MRTHGRFWLRWRGSILGLTGLVAVIFEVFGLLGYHDEGEALTIQAYILDTLPEYLIFCGIFVTGLAVSSFFQSYLPMILAMSGTRREVSLGVLLAPVETLAVLVAVISALSAAQNSFSWNVMLLQFGGGLAAASVFLTIGAAAVRWNRVGRIVAVVIYMLIGGVFGGTAMMVREGTWLKIIGEIGLRQWAVDKAVWGMLIGAVLYGLACVMVYRAVRRTEVRI